MKKAEQQSAEEGTFTCEICIEPSPLSHKFLHNYNCLHSFCVMCMTSHIRAKVEANTAAIHCPAPDCAETLDPIECQRMIPPRLFVKWCDCLCNAAVSGLKSCYCPYQHCSELILDECNEATRKWECPHCKGPFCYECRVPWHAGYRCDESPGGMDANDRLFGWLLVKMKWTRCPSCGQSVELVSGCRIVSCRCGRSFCHKCGKSHCACLQYRFVVEAVNGD